MRRVFTPRPEFALIDIRKAGEKTICLCFVSDAMFEPDAQVTEFLRRACVAWKVDPDSANVIDAARALERSFQLVMTSFRDTAPGSALPPEQPEGKSFSELTLGELLSATYHQTRGVQPVVPIEFLARRSKSPSGLWTTRAALEGIVTTTRTYSAHSKLQTSSVVLTQDPTREEKFQLIELAVGVAAELGLITAGKYDDYGHILQRRFERVPRLAPSRRPRGLESLPPKPFSKLFGRDAELVRLVEHVEENRTPISIEGEGGYGKTAAAWALADRVAERGGFAGVAWISGKRQSLGVTGVVQHSGLLRGELSLLTAVSRIFGLPRATDLDAIKEDLDSFLRRNKTLVVVDNWEDIPENARAGVDWLIERARVVVTSRPDSGIRPKVRLGRLQKLDLLRMLRTEYNRKVGGELKIREGLIERLDRVTAGNPLGVWWIVEKIRAGHGNLEGALSELERADHPLLEYCYQNLTQFMNDSGKMVARYLVASDGEVRALDFAALGLAEDAPDGIRNLIDLNLLVTAGGDGEPMALTPLCQRFLSQAWKDDPEQRDVITRWSAFQTQLDDRERFFRAGQFNTSALHAYMKSKEAQSTTPIRDYRDSQPHNPWGWYYLGIAERRWGRVEEAVSVLHRAREMMLGIPRANKHESYADVLRELALALRWLPYGRDSTLPEAITYVETAMEISNDPQLRLLVGELICENRQIPNGLSYLMDFFRDNNILLNEDHIRYAISRISYYAKRHPREPVPEARAKALEAAIDLIQPHLHGLRSPSAIADVANLYFAAANNFVIPVERRLVYLTKTESMLFPGLLIGVNKKGDMEGREACRELRARLERMHADASISDT